MFRKEYIKAYECNPMEQNPSQRKFPQITNIPQNTMQPVYCVF